MNLGDRSFPEVGIHIPLRDYVEKVISGAFGRQPDMSGDQRRRLMSHELRQVESAARELLEMMEALGVGQ